MMDSTRLRLVRWRRLFAGAFGLFLILVAVGIGFSQPPLCVVLVVLGVALALAILVVLHARSTRYRCPDCQEVFRISGVTDFASPHYPHKKLLKCPKCGVTAWCEETK